MTKKTIYLSGVLGLVWILAACQAGAGQGLSGAGQPDSPPLTSTPTGPTAIPTETPLPTVTPTPTATPIVILAPEPIPVEITTADGIVLSGTYFPADRNPAPLLILMHWARGDQTEWTEVAAWLQGRGLLEPAPEYNRSWKSSVWFPENTLPESIGVFTFTFRSCEAGCQAYLPVEWLEDVRAALATALDLQGVDRNRILTAGASIGADGAVYGCAWLNREGLGSCRGSFLLSPSSLLTVPFDETAGELLSLDPPLPVYCLIGLRDDASLETCSDVPNLITVDYGYIENHGLELLQPETGTNPLLLFQEFIRAALEGDSQ